jgi:hypothetical protein
VLVQLGNREMTTLTAGLKRTMTRLPEQLRRSLTLDRGMELADHKNVTIDTRAAGVLRRPPKPLAARLEREHEWPATPVPAQGHQHGRLTQDDLDAIAAKLDTAPAIGWALRPPPIDSPQLLR